MMAVREEAPAKAIDGSTNDYLKLIEQFNSKFSTVQIIKCDGNLVAHAIYTSALLPAIYLTIVITTFCH